MKHAAHDTDNQRWKKEQTWEVGRMLRVGLTDSRVHEGLVDGLVVGEIVVFWHQRQGT